MFAVLFLFFEFCVSRNTQKRNQTLKTLLPTIRGGWWWQDTSETEYEYGGVGGGTIADKDEDKDAEKDVDENKDLMKNDSV